nr:protein DETOXIFICATION 21-like [Ipomoea batatas]
MESDMSEKLLENKGNSEEEVKLGEKIWCEMKKMSVVALPAIFTRFTTFGISVISQAFIGHIDPIDLAAYALVQTVLLRFCNGVLDLLPVIKLSFSAGAMVCLELWYNSILVLLTGNLENAEVQIDALSICLNISGWEMMISLGFMAAACVRVANELGRGSAKAAKFSINVVVLTSFSIGVVLFLFFLFLRGNLAYLFTTSYDVVQAVDQMSPLLAFSILLNSVQPVLSGVAVGAGWQSTVAYVNLGCYYLIGIPVGVVLGYVFKFQVKGVWVGMLFGTFVQTIVLLVITFKTDWDKQVMGRASSPSFEQ